MFFLQPNILQWFKESMLLFFTNGYLSLKFENFAVLSKNIHYYFDKNNNIDSLNHCKIFGCRKNILSIFVALLTFYKFIIKKKEEENITF
jgi:hypothetical protein